MPMTQTDRIKNSLKNAIHVDVDYTSMIYMHLSNIRKSQEKLLNVIYVHISKLCCLTTAWSATLLNSASNRQMTTYGEVVEVAHITSMLILANSSLHTCHVVKHYFYFHVTITNYKNKS